MTTGKSGFQISQEGDVAIIRFDDPATRNALTMSMADDLRGHLTAAQSRARAVLLVGDARAFCSGANLNGGDAKRPGDFDAGLSLQNHFNPLMTAIMELNIPLITAVRGAAAGFGASLALIGDMIVAGQSAYFVQAFGRIALIPDGGAPWLLTKAIGRVRAMELVLLGDKLPAQIAHEWGLINRLVADEEVEPVALALAQRLAQGSATAIALTRRAAWAANVQSFAGQLDFERQFQTVTGYHPDFAEGVSAFQQKRPPQFSGALTPAEENILTHVINCCRPF